MSGKALQRYNEILAGERKAIYLSSKGHRIDFEPSLPTDRLWTMHSEAHSSARHKGEHTLLGLKAELGRRILSGCILCERRCGKNRIQGQTGHCGVLEPKISSEFLHMGEEPELVPSYTIFFAGCTFKCAFCQNWDISTHPDAGVDIPPRDMAKNIELRSRADGTRYGRAKNVNWVGGEPTPNLPYILEVLNVCSANIPQVWNSNMYMSGESMDLLDGVVDVYLADFKFGNDKCAMRLSNVRDYMEIVTRNHRRARSNGEMIIRHLVLPEHLECCTRPVLTWIADNLKDVKVNVMGQYRPEYNAGDFPEIAHPLSQTEFEEGVEIALELGLDLVD